MFGVLMSVPCADLGMETFVPCVLFLIALIGYLDLVISMFCIARNWVDIWGWALMYVFVVVRVGDGAAEMAGCGGVFW